MCSSLHLIFMTDRVLKKFDERHVKMQVAADTYKTIAEVKLLYAISTCITVVHIAILEATKSLGILRVNCDSVSSPNMKYPNTATPAYNTVHKAKLH